MVWTDERIATLRKLVEEGQTYSAITKTLGAGFSRSAVAGKIRRLKLASAGIRERRSRFVKAALPAPPAPTTKSRFNPSFARPKQAKPRPRPAQDDPIVQALLNAAYVAERRCQAMRGRNVN